MSIWLTPPIIIEIAFFLMIILDSIIYRFQYKELFDLDLKRQYSKKLIVFYLMAWLILGLLETQIQITSQFIHGIVIIVSLSFNLIILFFIKAEQKVNTSDDPNFPTGKMRRLRLLSILIVIIIAVFGFTTEKLKDFHFTGSNVIIVASDAKTSEFDMSKIIESSIDCDLLRVQKYGAATLEGIQYFKIEFNSHVEIADSTIERMLISKLSHLIPDNSTQDVIVSSAKYGQLYDSDTINIFSIFLLTVFVITLIFYSIAHRNFIQGLKTAIIQDILVLTMIGLLFFFQKIIPKYIVDKLFFQITALFLISCVYKLFIYATAGALIYSRKYYKLLLILILISIPLKVYYDWSLVVPFLLIGVFGLFITDIYDLIMNNKRTTTRGKKHCADSANFEQSNK
ncbi:hypothetical protein [Geofilum rhodophaeum]|uniref:hypothetical protein n=1 Tax=Geofilum rhodophaeum TaxID=1965019 RepID=UPI000B522B51|nr:hypothetical protein [Geofilum rhodophaeum]